MNNSFYFQHDYNARNDQKILELRAEYGAEGYGIWWMLLETLAEQDGIDGGAIGGLSLAFGVPKEKLQNVINHCIELGLLYNENGVLRNNRMDGHKKWRESLSQAGKKGAENRWKDGGANGGANGDRMAQDRIGQDSKGQDRKEKNSGQKALPDRQAEFKNLCYQLGNELGVRNDILEQFYEYWAEVDDNGNKMKKEKQKTFGTKARLKTWLRKHKERTGETGLKGNKAIDKTGKSNYRIKDV